MWRVQKNDVLLSYYKNWRLTMTTKKRKCKSLYKSSKFDETIIQKFVV